MSDAASTDTTSTNAASTGPPSTGPLAAPFVDGLYFGECPRWHEGRLWYSDFFAHGVFSASPDGASRQELDVASEPAGLGWLPDGRLLVASRQERVVLRREPDGALVHHGTLLPWAGFHANDMVVSANGRAYTGNFGFDLDAYIASPEVRRLFSDPGPPTASLVRVDPDGSSHEAASGLRFPNGTVLTPDGRTLVVAETLANRLTAFTVDADGTLGDRRTWGQLEGIVPDGICLDAEGAIWVANAIATECVRVRAGGEVAERVRTSQPCFACMLGGDDRRTLYLVTAPSSIEKEARRQRLGRIEQARVAVPGAGLP